MLKFGTNTLNTLMKSPVTVLNAVECIVNVIRLADMALTMDQMSKSHYAELSVSAEAAQKMYDHLMMYGDYMPDDLLNQFLRTYRRIAERGSRNGRRQIEAMKQYGW